MDVEPILPGEDECAAALRLLGRARRFYGTRFFDALSVDGWYAKGPFLRAVEKLGWSWVVVLKREDMAVYREAHTLSHGQKPSWAFEDQERQRQVQLWEVKDLPFSDGYGQSVRVVRSEERWIENRVQGGQTQSHPRNTQWLWAASAQLDGYDGSLIYHAGHRRWGIENKAFNELTQYYHLEHCYHHEPAAMLAQMLILVLGFALFSAYAVLYNQQIRLGQITMKALTHDMDLALEADLPWDLRFHTG